jgi:hypothetical protein
MAAGCHKSPQEIDSFEKYSYLLVLQKTGHISKPGAGTGFLIKVDTSIYCVTASHVYNGIDVFKKEYAEAYKLFDTLFFRYNTLTGHTKYIGFYIGDVKAEPFYYFEYPDLMAFKIPNLGDSPIYNIVNKYMDSYDLYNGTPEKVFFYGFNIERHKDSLVYTDSVLPDYYEGVIKGGLFNYPQKEYKSELLQLSLSIMNEDTINFQIEKRPYHGQSGSPLFFQFSKKGISTYSFGGIVFGTNTIGDYGYVVRPEELIKLIKSIN